MNIFRKRALTIWSFVAFIFIIYGLVITGAGIYYLFYSQPEVALANLNASLVWGVLLVVVGLVFNWIDLRSNTRK